MADTRRNLPIKIAVAAIVLAGLGFLFVRSAREARTAPYTLQRQQLRNWTLALQSASSPTAPMLVLRPPAELAPDVFHQIFARAMETLSAPDVAAMPIVLQNEFEAALAGHVTPNALLDAARKAGLDAAPLVPQCLALRRVSEPGIRRQLYFVLFDFPALGRFRGEMGALRGDTALPTGFDPAALSPVVIIAGSGQGFNSWLPLRADPDADCVAPIAVQ